jgi:hypothetical protein
VPKNATPFMQDDCQEIFFGFVLWFSGRTWGYVLVVWYSLWSRRLICHWLSHKSWWHRFPLCFISLPPPLGSI